MQELFVRTLSQGLQAFMPVAAYLVYARSQGRAYHASAARWGIIAALPLTIPAGYLFQTTTYQARWEASLASLAVAATVLACHITDRRWRWAVAPLATMIVVRQTMEIAVVFAAAAFTLRSRDATLAVSSAVAITALIAFAWTWTARRVSPPVLARASRVFAAVFLVQGTIYALHEWSEARALPWSEALHTASEPYGPEGMYGRAISGLLVALPVAAIAIAWLRTTAAALARDARAAALRHRMPVLASAVTLVIASVAFVALGRDRATAATAQPEVQRTERSVSPDGRVGAVTVFLTTGGNGTAQSSAKTSLIDMSTGDVLGDLDQFTTWRDGARFTSADFSFWGVTFVDSNVFHASLGTGGKIYKVQGDLGLRKLTVLGH